MRFYIWLMVVFLLACGNSRGQIEAAQETEQGVPAELLPLPSISKALTTPQARADYLTLHFWDAMDFTDHASSLDTAFMEQNFVNFIQLYDIASGKGVIDATSSLLTKAAADTSAYRFLFGIAERYLSDPNSPMLNEEHFIPFLDKALTMQLFDDTEKMRLEYMREVAMKNRPGTLAADFRFRDRTGTDKSLLSLPATEYTLLIFYDPDCETCHGVMDELSASDALNRMINAGKLSVVAVDFETDRSRWNSTKDSLPENWTVGFDKSDIEDNDIYFIRATPTMYLLDVDKQVIAKDISIVRLFKWIQGM